MLSTDSTRVVLIKKIQDQKPPPLATPYKLLTQATAPYVRVTRYRKNAIPLNLIKNAISLRVVKNATVVILYARNALYSI